MDEVALLNGEQIPWGDFNPQQLDEAIDQPAAQVNGHGGVPTASPAAQAGHRAIDGDVFKQLFLKRDSHEHP